MQYQLPTILFSLLALTSASPISSRGQNPPVAGIANNTAIANSNSTANLDSNSQNQGNLLISNQNQLAALLASQNIASSSFAQIETLVASQSSSGDANELLALLSSSQNSIASFNGLDAAGLNQLLASGASASQLYALIGAGLNQAQIASVLASSVSSQDLELDQLLTDLGNGNIANGASNMANLILSATNNNAVIANDLENLLVAQGLAAPPPQAASVTVVVG